MQFLQYISTICLHLVSFFIQLTGYIIYLWLFWVVRYVEIEKRKSFHIYWTINCWYSAPILFMHGSMPTFIFRPLYLDKWGPSWMWTFSSFVAFLVASIISCLHLWKSVTCYHLQKKSIITLFRFHISLLFAPERFILKTFALHVYFETSTSLDIWTGMDSCASTSGYCCIMLGTNLNSCWSLRICTRTSDCKRFVIVCHLYVLVNLFLTVIAGDSSSQVNFVVLYILFIQIKTNLTDTLFNLC